MKTTTHTHTKQTLNIGDITNKIMQPVTEKRHTIKRNTWKPLFSRFKLKIYYKDGNSKTFYSYDIFNRYQSGIKEVVTDEQTGYQKLFAYITSVQSSIKTCCIYLTLEKEQGTQNAKYEHEIFKGVNTTKGWESRKNERLFFKDGFLASDIFKMQLMEQMEKGVKNV